MADYDDGNNGKVGGSGMGRIMTTMHSDKCQAWPPTDNFKRLIEEACTNHAYPIRHKVNDCDMMKCFMISGSPTVENTVMMDYGGCGGGGGGGGGGEVPAPPPPRLGGITCLR
jgi:hypothetical protein